MKQRCLDRRGDGSGHPLLGGKRSPPQLDLEIRAAGKAPRCSFSCPPENRSSQQHFRSRCRDNDTALGESFPRSRRDKLEKINRAAGIFFTRFPTRGLLPQPRFTFILPVCDNHNRNRTSTMGCLQSQRTLHLNRSSYFSRSQQTVHLSRHSSLSPCP